MRTYLVSAVICFLCNTLPAVTFYECTPEKSLSRPTKYFDKLIIGYFENNTIHLNRIIPMGDDEVLLDEQFLKPKQSHCRIPGKAGRKFYSQDIRNKSINGYRLEHAAFRDYVPFYFKLSYVLDETGDGSTCIPAIYYCSTFLKPNK